MSYNGGVPPYQNGGGGHIPPPHHQPQQQPQSQSSQPNSSGNGSMPYDDPTNLLQVYPFMTYQPTARAAMHLGPHTRTYALPSSSSELYPQHASLFNRLDNPSTPEDWEMRNSAQAQIRNMLNTAGPSYYNGYQPIPDISAYPPSSLTPYPTANPPMPYHFLPSYLPSPAATQRGPPTPTSISENGPSPTSSASAAEYFNDFVKQTLNRKHRQDQAQTQSQPQTQALQHPQPRPHDAQYQQYPSQTQPPPSHPLTPSSGIHRQSPVPVPKPVVARRPSSAASVSSTPGLASAMERADLSSPDPLSFTGSPSKKRKSSKHVSPTLQYSQRLPKMEQPHASSSSSALTPLPSSSHASSSKQRIMVKVEIPTKKKAHLGEEEEEEEDSEEDDLGWDRVDEDKDGDWQMDPVDRKAFRSPSPGQYGRSAPPGSGRTGERDMRTHFQKLQSLLEDIFEESDSFPAEPTEEDIASSRYFSPLSRDGTLPLLSDSTLERISRYINRVQKGKRRQSVGENLVWDDDTISRTLRLLERCMRDTEDIAPFADDKVATAKKGKSSKGKRSKSPSLPADDENEVETKPGDDILSEEELGEGERKLSMLLSAGLAAECCLVILSSEGLSKQLLSEDLLSSAVRIVKAQMTKVIIPVVEALAGEKISSKFLDRIVQLEQTRITKSKKVSPLFMDPALAAITSSCIASLPRLTSLIVRLDIAFSDQLVIQTVYLAIAPLFVVEPTAKKGKGKDGLAGLAVLKGLRVEALGYLRGIFARYEEQRRWIIEEILSSMGKASDTNNALARFQLANGASIHTISALLLQLIQASAFGVTSKVRRLRSSIFDAESGSGSQTPAEKPDVMDEEIQLCTETMDSASKSARIVAAYLVQRSSSSKTNKGTHDTDYKAILDIFLADLLAVLYQPEWPAAPLYLTVFSRLMTSALEDRQSAASDSAAKSVALDHLGDIAAKLRGFHLQMTKNPIASLDEFISNADIEACTALSAKHKIINAFLSAGARDDGMFVSALDMTTLLWAQELQTAIKKSQSIIEKLAEEKDDEAQETRGKLQTIGQNLRSTLRSVWMGDDNLFDLSDLNQAALAHEANIVVARGRSLQSAFNPILSALISTMGSPTIALRSKALRGLGSVITVDPDVLSHATVRAAIEDRLSDPSPSVRDAAVELVGKYVVQKPDLAAEYYPHLALRVSDSGLAVRKRVIKLLRGIFAATLDRDIKVDICCKMITLSGDTDDNIKDLATKTVTDMFYPPDVKASDTASLLVDVISEYQGGHVMLEGAMTDIVRECIKIGVDDRLATTVDILFERLSDATERSDIDPLSHIRAINLLSEARSDLIDVTRAEILLSHLKRKPANSDEQASNEVLLRIFKLGIPSMPRVASSFALKLNEDLVAMISVPSGGFPILKETIACFCAVANHLTRDLTPLLKILTSCEGKVRVMRNEWITTQKATKAQSPAAPILLFICASIAEFCKLDEISGRDPVVETALNKITEGTLHEHLFECFLDFTAMPIPQVAPSICLGSLFRAYPSLILHEEAMKWMDGVFSGNDTAAQARLLGVIYDFLVSESEKKQAPASVVTPKKGGKTKKGKALGDLIGNAVDLSESGLSTAVVQRNIGHILDGAKSLHPQMQNAALDILAFTVNQGLYHPLQCLPILISLETSENEQIAERALDLHHTLHSKHSTLVNVRYEEFAKASYEYQRSITSEVVGHRDGRALLSGWYSLIGEKRSWKHEFLKQLARAFDYDVAGKVEPDVGFVLYLCDNLCTLEYKLQEEVMTVVHLLSEVVSASTGLVMILERTQLEGNPTDGIAHRFVTAVEETETMRVDVVIHASIVVGLAVLVKNHLLDVYSIPEDKCIKHVPGKKSTIGDKPAIRKKEAVLDTSRMVLVRGVSTVADFASQRSTFLELIHEDGSLEVEFD